MRRPSLAAAVVLAAAVAPAFAADPPTAVRVVKAGGFELVRDGKPYLIKGAGGSGPLDLLARLGGNSVRTWGTDGLDKVLDDAHKNGLTVTVGIWFGHERHGFNYNDADQVAGQLEKVRQAVTRYKDHPAVLMWGLGNEMEGYEKGDNAAIWSAINSAACLVKKLDPNHPTMTVVAEIGGDRVKNIHRLCPEVDVVGINSYGGAAGIPDRYRKAGGTKPYVLTEFGPPGVWESAKNKWGAVPEPTSTAKAEFYRRAYEKAVLGSGGLCLGSYAFTWGNKQEATATWFGLLLPDRSRLAPADALSELWTGKPVPHPCPEIRSLTIDGPDQVEPGATVRAKLSVADPAGGPLPPGAVEWVLQKEPSALGTGGDAEEAPPTFPDAVGTPSPDGVQVTMPKEGGGYRLFVTVRDGHGGAATANVPLKVNGPVVVPFGKKADLPLVVYDEGDRVKPAFAPTGWMGNTKGLKVDEASADAPHAGKTCLRLEYAPADGWAGVVWQSPPNDWGTRAGGWDATGAKALTFWARGAKGGEKVGFEFGILGKDKPVPDTAKGKLGAVTLTADWKRYEIPLTGQDLRRVKTGFVCTVAGQGGPVIVYLDDVKFE